jgi:hypothetical protein
MGKEESQDEWVEVSPIWKYGSMVVVIVVGLSKAINISLSRSMCVPLSYLVVKETMAISSAHF